NTQGFSATLNGPLTNFASASLGLAAGTLRKSGTGRLQINAAGTLNGYAVQLNANGGGLRLPPNRSPPLTPPPPHRGAPLTAGTPLTVDNPTLPAGSPPGPVTTDRVNDAATVALASGATLQLLGNATQAATEAVGTVTATGNGGAIRADSSGGVAAALRIGN